MLQRLMPPSLMRPSLVHPSLVARAFFSLSTAPRAALYHPLMLALAALLALSAIQSSAQPPAHSADILIADFESETYAPWVATGEAFGHAPAQGTLPNQMPVDGHLGSRLVNSFSQGDASTGILTSPEFTIERPYISFLIGGGKDLENTCIQLLIADTVFRVATGPNDRPGGSERLAPDGWDVRDLIGKRAKIRIIDHAKGGWGHINVDHIVLTDRKPPITLTNVRRDFNVTARYLNIPIKNGAPKRRVTLLANDWIEVENDIELADAAPDWWAPMDVSDYQGSSITLEVDSLRDDSAALSSITLSDAIRDSDNLYDEPLRAQFHFSPRRGWTNDPNGLVHFNGEYHLFFQHNPYGWGWGNMHWGHAVSKDLVHWSELNDALAPDAFGTVYSGSAVVDHANTSGLGKPGAPAMVLFYTAAGNPFTQCLAYSTDGRSFTKVDTNPILGNIAPENRDPKVIWHAPSKRWIMTLYVGTEGKHWVYFLGSSNLRQWKQLSRIDGFYECPDFFELPLDGDQAHMKWVLTAASSEYMIGSFDGTTFTPETPKLPGHRGRGFYAAQTFSDMPDGRRIQIGWFQTETPGMAFNQSMTIPLELSLVSTPDGPRLCWNPARELESLRVKRHEVGSFTLTPETSRNPLSPVNAELLEMRTTIEPKGDVSLTMRGVKIAYEVRSGELAVNDHRVKVPLVNGKLQLTIYCDRVGMEIFAGGGLVYIPMPIVPNDADRSVSFTPCIGDVKVESLVVHELRSAWKGK